MEDKTGEANVENVEESPLLPPETSITSNGAPVSEDCGPSGTKEEPESISMEEHFAWLIDLIDEPPETYRHYSNVLNLHGPGLRSDTHLQTDSKEVKQLFPQRSRVRKLQYITELENSVQALQAEGLEVLAQLQYLDKQNFLLSFENEALKQRLNTMLREQLIRCMQNNMLKRELHRLHQLLQQQRPPQPSNNPRSY